MNYFVIIEEIEEIEEFSEVKCYSAKIIVEEVDNSEFEKFILKFEEHENEELKEEFENIIAVIEAIGEKSARVNYFRSENAAFALPPRPNIKIENIEIKLHSSLRLYCVLVNENIVILCNGGQKTTNKVQDCPNVSSYFRFAEKLALYLEKTEEILILMKRKWTLEKNMVFTFK